MASIARKLDLIDVTPFSAADAAAMEARFAGVGTSEMLGELLTGELKGRVAAVSSFGAESAVLLHLIAQIDRDIPVIFLNTQKIFGETLAYRDQVSEQLGFTAPAYDHLRDWAPACAGEGDRRRHPCHATDARHARHGHGTSRPCLWGWLRHLAQPRQ